MRFIALKPHHLELIPDKARPTLCADTRGILAVDDNDQPCAACVLDSWSLNSMMVHIWIKNPMVLKYGFVRECFEFAFSNGRTKMVGVTPSDNEKALGFIKRVGFVELGRIEDGYAKGVDYVITEFRKEWLEEDYGQQRRA